MKTLQTGKTFDQENYAIYQIEDTNDFGKIRTDSIDNTYYFGDYQFRVEQVNNDVYGNPLYKVQLYESYRNITHMFKGMVHRVYSTKGYALVQSYNLGDTLKGLMEKISK